MEGEFSIFDLILKFEKKELNGYTFKIIGQDQFIRIKNTHLERNEKNSLMLQIKNVSSEIQYDNEKSHSDLLMMINATVSHELRNPLNSLIAQNIEKKALYKEVIKVVLQSKIDDVAK
jgi:signal transduction histidine kinase